MARTSILSQQALEALNEQLSSLQPYQRANLLASLDAKQIGDSIEHGRDEYRDELTNFVLSAGSHLIFHPKAYLPDVVRKFEKFSEIYLESVRVLISVFQSECTYLRKSSRIDSRLGELSDHLRTLEAATDAKTIEKIDAGHMPDREMRDSNLSSNAKAC